MAQQHRDRRKTKLPSLVVMAVTNNHVVRRPPFSMNVKYVKGFFHNASYLHSYSLLTWSGMTTKGIELTTAMNVCKESVLQSETTQEPNRAIPVISQDLWPQGRVPFSLSPSRCRQEPGQPQPSAPRHTWAYRGVPTQDESPFPAFLPEVWSAGDHQGS